jgi:hypothetical protein
VEVNHGGDSGRLLKYVLKCAYPQVSVMIQPAKLALGPARKVRQ